MLVVAFALVMVACARQAHDSPEILKLIRQLRSDNVEERDRAVKEFKRIGRQAKPCLEELARDKDVEVATRARQILRTIEIRDFLTLAILRAYPGLDDRLADYGDEEWTEAFLHLTRVHRGLGRRDFSVLASRALRGAKTHQAKKAVLGGISEWRCRAVAPDVAKLINDSDDEVRKTALETLGNLRAREYGEQIIRCLKDPDYPVRMAAARILGSLKEEHAIPALIEALHDPESHVRREALLALGAIEAVEAASAILERLRDEEFQVHTVAARVAGELVGDRLRARIEELLEDSDPGIRSNAARALLAIDGHEARPIFLRKMSDPDPRVRSSLAEAIPILQEKEAKDAFRRFLRDQEDSVRVAALSRLGDVDFAFAEPDLIERLSDSVLEIKQTAAIFLSRLGRKEAIPLLVPLLEDPDPNIRRNASRWLSEMRIGETADCLKRLLDHPDPTIAIVALDGIRNLSMPEAGPAILRFLEDKRPLIRSEVVRRLHWADHESVLSRLGSLLGDEDANVRRGAILMAGILEAGSRYPDFLEILRSDRPEVRSSALAALGELKVKEAIPRILEFLKDSNPQVRQSAVRALGMIGKGSIHPAILTSLGDEEAIVRLEALKVIKRIGDPDSFREVVLRLKDKDVLVRAKAAEVLVALLGIDAVTMIPHLAQDESSDVREAVASALGGGKGASVQSVLGVLVRDDDPRVARAALLSLRRIGGTVGFRDLVEYTLSAKDPCEADFAVELLKVGKTQVSEIIRGAEHPEMEVRRLSALALGRCPVPESVSVLRRLLSDAEENVILAVVHSLGRLRANDSIPDLSKLLGHRSSRIRVSAAAVLAAMDSSEGRRVLIASLSVGPEEVRKLAASHCVRLRLKDAVPILERLYGPGHGQVGCMAPIFTELNSSRTADSIIPALGFPGPKEATIAALEALNAKDKEETISRYLTDKRVEVRVNAARCLCRLGSVKGVTVLLNEASVSVTQSLVSLNVLRRPDLWKKFRSTPWIPRKGASFGSLLNELGKDVGLPVVYSSPLVEDLIDTECRSGLIELDGLMISDVFMNLMDSPIPVDAVLENDHILIVPKALALTFWRNWWESCQRKEREIPQKG